MNEGMLARRPGKAPCPLPPTTPSPACVRPALPRPLADSCDPRLVTFCCRPCWQGEGGLRRPAGLHVRAHTCVHRSCLLSGYPPARAHACVHSFMHERMVYGRKACRVGLPLSFVGGLANGDVDFRLTLDQISGAARCSRQGTAITTVSDLPSASLLSFSVLACTASSPFPRLCRRVLSTGFSVLLCTRVVFAYYSSARRGRCRSGCGIGTHS